MTTSRPPKGRARRASPATPGLTLAQIGRGLGVGERSLYRLREAGDIAPVIPGKGPKGAIYDPLAVARVLIQKPEDAREARDRAQAEWMQLRIAKERRELLPRGEVVRAGRGIVQTVTSRLLRLPADLVHLAGLPAKREVDAERVVREALEELARLENVEGLAS